MATNTTTIPHTTDLRSPLRKLRRRIRVYVWLEGLSLAVVWLALTFWVGLAVDYLPVMAGASEMPHTARLVFLIATAVVLAWIFYRWILRRTFVRLPDHSMALLLERKFGQFDDALVTAVELSDQPSPAGSLQQGMLEHTRQNAGSGLAGLPLRQVFRVSPLLAKGLLAVVATGSIGLFYVMNAQAFDIWTSRLYLLQDHMWPRKTQLEVIGIQLQRISPTDGSQQLSELIPFSTNREVKIAKGASAVVKVAADAAKVIPEYCTIHYRTQEGQRGEVNMQKLGRIREGAQLFTYSEKPFRGILSSIDFDVRGLDHRVRDYRLTVVPSPAIVETQLACVFPEYMVNEELSLWLPRTVDLVSGTQLPIGTHVTISARSNKELASVIIRDKRDGSMTTIELDAGTAERQSFDFTVPSLRENLELEITLLDTDGVSNDPPHKLFIAGIQDSPPEINVTLRGIGTAITPQAIIPAIGKINDDYDIARSWFELRINDGETRQLDFALQPGQVVDAAVDFREMELEGDEFVVKPKDKLSMTVMAADKYDLGDTPNVGTGDRYQLEVVTADELLAMLERRELGLRRRFEQVIEELNEMRDSLSRIKSDPDSKAGTAPEDRDDTATNNSEADDRIESLRLLRTQRAVMQSQKSAQELLGIAESFADIRQELINNRIDSEDRKTRLQDQIITPLRSVCQDLFPRLDQRLQELEKNIADENQRDSATDAVLETTEEILFALDQVLQKMVELETYNELVNIVRSLIKNQEELLEKTKKERVNQVRSLLE
jgi:hypothetical protein